MTTPITSRDVSVLRAVCDGCDGPRPCEEHTPNAHLWLVTAGAFELRDARGRHAIDPTRALFADDMVRNLAPAKAIGMATLWVDNVSEQGPALAPDGVVDYRTGDIAAWLGALIGGDL